MHFVKCFLRKTTDGHMMNAQAAAYFTLIFRLSTDPGQFSATISTKKKAVPTQETLRLQEKTNKNIFRRQIDGLKLQKSIYKDRRKLRGV